MCKGTKEWGEHLQECVANGYGVMITQNIAVVRSWSDSKHGWGIEIGDVRTGKQIDIRISPKGEKVEVIGVLK